MTLLCKVIQKGRADFVQAWHVIFRRNEIRHGLAAIPAHVHMTKSARAASCSGAYISSGVSLTLREYPRHHSALKTPSQASRRQSRAHAQHGSCLRCHKRYAGCLSGTDASFHGLGRYARRHS